MPKEPWAEYPKSSASHNNSLHVYRCIIVCMRCMLQVGKFGRPAGAAGDGQRPGGTHHGLRAPIVWTRQMFSHPTPPPPIPWIFPSGEKKSTEFFRGGENSTDFSVCTREKCRKNPSVPVKSAEKVRLQHLNLIEIPRNRSRSFIYSTFLKCYFNPHF